MTKKVSRNLLLRAREARLLFDGAVLPTAEAAAEAVHAPANADSDAQDQSFEAAQHQLAAVDPVADPAPAGIQVVVYDAAIAEVPRLLQGLPEGAIIIALDGERDPLTVIAERLEGVGQVDTIHIISHGDEGRLDLAGWEITDQTLAAHSDTLARWGAVLSADADILLYGCDVAKGDSGAAFVAIMSGLTGADVAASTDATGSAALGGDWDLESRSGQVESTVFTAEDFDGILGATDLASKEDWVPVLAGVLHDPQGDSQAKAADTDLVGNANRAVLYASFDDRGTADEADDFIAFRIRVDNPTSNTYFGGVAVVGIDANADGRVDVFLAVDGRNNTQAVRILDPGTGLNNSPNTTSTSALPTGWLPNNGVYSFSASNYSVNAVSATTDPQWAANGGDLGADGKTDVFVSFKIPMKDLATVLAKASQVDRQGAYGPRGSEGIAGYDKDTSVSYIVMTQTQPGPLNGDLGGVGPSYDKYATFSELGAFSAQMTAAEPTAIGKTVDVVSIGDGNLSQAESASTAISGTAGSTVADGDWVRVVVADGNGGSRIFYAQVTSGAWTVAAADLSGLAQGTLTATAGLWTTGDGSGQAVPGSVGDSMDALLDKTAPVIGVTSLATAGRPTISGTSDLPAGTVLQVTVDDDGNAGTAGDAVTYLVTVQAGGAWSVNTATATPSSGSVPAAGFTRYALVTATGADTAGNSTTATAITKPTVDSQTTTDRTPAITGTWGGTNGGTDSLSVTVAGVTYTEGANLVIAGKAWTLTPPSDIAVQTHDVTATVTRNTGGTSDDLTTAELSVVGSPTVAIGSAATQSTSTPTITGTTSLPVGTVLVVRLNPGDDGDASDAVSYAVTVGAGGTWTLNTSSAQPLSGVLPAGGLNGAVGVTATGSDSNGQTVTATQTLTINAPRVDITTIQGANSGAALLGDDILNAAEDDSVAITGTSTNAVGETVTVTVTDGVTTRTATATVAGDGTWSTTFAGGTTLGALNDGTLTVKAVIGDTSDTEMVSHDKTPPVVILTTPSVIKKTAPVISGETDMVAGSVIRLSHVYNTTTYSVDATVQANGSFSATIPLGQGQNNGAITVTATPISGGTDTAGNAAVAVQQTVDLQAPNTNAPTVAIGSITGVNYATGDTTISTADITNGVTIAGTTSISTGTLTLTVTDGTLTKTSAGDFTLTRNGTAWTATLPSSLVDDFANGTFKVTASLYDGSTFTVIDVALPNLLLMTGVPSVTIDQPIATDNLVNGTEHTSVTISGGTSNAIGGTVTLTISDGNAGTTDVTATAAVQAGGRWTVTGLDLSGLDEATLTVTAVVDADNNAATANGAQVSTTIVYDATPPVLHVTSAATAGDSTPVISGTSDLAEGATVTITIDPSGTPVVYTATVAANGAWSIDTSSATPVSGTFPAAGIATTTKITVAATDAAGNSGSTTAASVVSISQDTGTNTADFITKDATLVYSGRAAANATVVVTLTGAGNAQAFQQTVTADGAGVWSVDRSALAGVAAGTYTLTGVATDAAGNTATATQEITVDTSVAVAITGMTDDTATAGDYITSDTKPVFSGTADAGATVVVSLTSGNTTAFTATVVAAGNGTWSVDRSAFAALPSGSYTLTATATDAVGNSAAATQAVVIDADLPVIGFTTNGRTPDTTPVITGTTDLPEGATVTITIDGGAPYTATVQKGGLWSVQTTTALSGTVTVTATGTDAAGNTVTATMPLIIDAAAPTIAITDIAGSFGDANQNGTVSAAEDNTVPVAGTTTGLADGSVVTVTITDGSRSITDTATITGNSWALAGNVDISGMADGVITVTAAYVDAGGNTYLDTASFLHDKTPPVATLTAQSTTITGPVTVTATFNEKVTGLTAADFATSNNAVVSDLASSDGGKTWTFTLTPAAIGTASVWLPAARCDDLAGNPGTASPPLSFTVTQGNADASAPTLVSILRQGSTPELTNEDAPTFRVTFSEPVSGLDATDFQVAVGGNAVAGAVQSITAVNGLPGAYDVVLGAAGITSGNGTLTLSVVGAGHGITDAAANPLVDNTAELAQTYTLDNVAPTVTNGGITATGATITITYGEVLANAPPAAGDYTVATTAGTGITVTGASINTVDNTVTLSLSRAIASSETVTLTYTAANKIKDPAGNFAAPYAAAPVTNLSPAPDTTAPVVDLNGAGAGITHAATTTGAAVSLDSADAATVVEASDKVTALTITVGGLLNGASEKLVFGATTLAANGSGGGASAITVGGVSVNVVQSGSTFTIQKADWTTLTAAQAQAIIRDIQYRNDAEPVTAGDRTFSFTATDQATNVSAAAVSTVTVTTAAQDTTAPTLTSVLRQTPAGEMTNADTVTYRVTFSEPVTGLAAADFAVSGLTGAEIGTVTAVTPGVYDVTVTGIAAANGTLTLALAGDSTVNDTAGNALTNRTATGATQTYTLDNLASVAIASVAGDGLVNGTEAATTTVSGTASNIEAGRTVTVTVTGNGHAAVTGTATIQAGGGWSVTGLDLSGFDQGTLTVAAAISDQAGNSASAETTATLDSEAPTLTSVLRQTPAGELTNADTVTYRVTFSEPVTGLAAADFAVSGLTGAEVGTVTAVTPGVYDVTITGIAAANGTLTLALAGDSTVNDTAGNALTNRTATGATQTYTLDNLASVAIASVAGDGLVNGAEAGTTTVSGTASNIEAGRTVTVTVTGSGHAAVTGTATIQAGGGWSVTGLDLSGFDQGTLTVAAAISDQAGNSASAETTATLDTTAPTLTSVLRQTPAGEMTNADTVTYRVTFSEPVTGLAAADFAVSGLTGAEIGTVTAVTPGVYDVTVTGIAAANGTLTLALAGDSTVNDTAGNALTNRTATGATQTYTLDNLASVAIASVASDGLVNGAEAGTTTVTGTASNIEVGRTVTVTVTGNGHAAVTGTATIQAGGGWSVTGLDLSGFDQGTLTVAAAISDQAGNSASAETTATLDTTAPTLTSVLRQTPGAELTNADTVTYRVTFSEPVTGLAAADFAVSGLTGAEIGTVTAVTPGVYDVTITGIAAANGTLTLALAGDSTVNDTAGNPLTNRIATGATQTYTLDNLASVAIASVAGDGLVNGAEAGTTTVTGTASNIEVGRTVTVTVTGNGHAAVTGTATIQAGGGWSVTGLDLSGFDQGTLTVAAAISDQAGNSASAETTATLDTLPPAAPVVTSLNTDDTTPTITGTWAAGSGTLSVTVGGFTYTAGDGNLSVQGGTWSLTIPADRALPLATHQVVATVVDAAGNSIQDISVEELTVREPTNDTPYIPPPDASNLQASAPTLTTAPVTTPTTPITIAPTAPLPPSIVPQQTDGPTTGQGFAPPPGGNQASGGSLTFAANSPTVQSVGDVEVQVVTASSSASTTAADTEIQTYVIAAKDNGGGTVQIGVESGLPPWMKVESQGDGNLKVSGERPATDKDTYQMIVKIKRPGGEEVNVVLVVAPSGTTGQPGQNDAPAAPAPAPTEAQQPAPADGNAAADWVDRLLAAFVEPAPAANSPQVASFLDQLAEDHNSGDAKVAVLAGSEAA